MRGLGLDPHIFILNFGESYSRIKKLMGFCGIVTSSNSEYKTLNGNLASYLIGKTDSELVYITSTGDISALRHVEGAKSTIEPTCTTEGFFGILNAQAY